MSEIHLVRDYRQPPAQVWRALTEPSLMEQWMVAARPQRFRAEPGAHFQFVGPARPGWSGVVECVVLESREPTLLRYSWCADGGQVQHIRYQLEPLADGGTRFTFHHTGFTGVGGFLLSKLVMTGVRKTMFGVKLPALLETLQ